MPQIEVSQQTFERLQALARPLIDSSDAVISRLIDFRIAATTQDDNFPGPELEFPPDSPPTLTFTKLREAAFANQKIQRPTWAELVRVSIEFGMIRFGFEHLQKITDANITRGRRDGDGYAYIPHLDISLQGEDAPDCWRIAFALARKLSVPILVHFEWRDKEGAAHPGKTGRLDWRPSTGTSISARSPLVP